MANSDVTEEVEIYVATGEKDPHAVLVGDRKLTELVQEANTYLAEHTSTKHVRLRTVTDEEFSLPRFSVMDWETEKSFRERLVGLCVIDGRYFTRFVKEIFTIRAHHFPPFADYPAYCIVFPQEAVKEYEAEREGDAMEVLEEEFRCKLVEPSAHGFKTFIRTIRTLAQINGVSLQRVFKEEEG